MRATLATASAAPTIDDVLAGYVLQRQLKPGLDATQAENFRETAARVLSRLEMAGAAALPQELEALAKAIVLAPTIERAEAFTLLDGVPRDEAMAAVKDGRAETIQVEYNLLAQEPRENIFPFAAENP